MGINLHHYKTKEVSPFQIKTSSFEWRLDNIRIKNIIWAPIWAPIFFFFWGGGSALLDVRHCPKLQSCAISRKTNDATLRKWKQKFVMGFTSTSS